MDLVMLYSPFSDVLRHSSLLVVQTEIASTVVNDPVKTTKAVVIAEPSIPVSVVTPYIRTAIVA